MASCLLLFLKCLFSWEFCSWSTSLNLHDLSRWSYLLLSWKIIILYLIQTFFLSSRSIILNLHKTQNQLFSINSHSASVLPTIISRQKCENNPRLYFPPHLNFHVIYLGVLTVLSPKYLSNPYSLLLHCYCLSSTRLFLELFQYSPNGSPCPQSLAIDTSLTLMLNWSKKNKFHCILLCL